MNSGLKCCKYTCGQPRDPGLVALHYFPLEPPELVRKWVEFCDQPTRRVVSMPGSGRTIEEVPWFPTPKSCICSRHFVEADYHGGANTSNKLLRLRRGCVPTVEGQMFHKSWRTEGQPPDEMKYADQRPSVEPQGDNVMVMPEPSWMEAMAQQNQPDDNHPDIKDNPAEEGLMLMPVKEEAESDNSDVSQSATDDEVSDTIKPAPQEASSSPVTSNVKIKIEPVDEANTTITADPDSGADYHADGLYCMEIKTENEISDTSQNLNEIENRRDRSGMKLNRCDEGSELFMQVDEIPDEDPKMYKKIQKKTRSEVEVSRAVSDAGTTVEDSYNRPEPKIAAFVIVQDKNKISETMDKIGKFDYEDSDEEVSMLDVEGEEFVDSVEDPDWSGGDSVKKMKQTFKHSESRPPENSDSTRHSTDEEAETEDTKDQQSESKYETELLPENLYYKYLTRTEQVTCDFCSVDFQWSEIMNHRKTHNPEPIMKCNICGKVARKVPHLRNHIYTKHSTNVPLLACRECGKTFRLQHLLENHHQRVHERNESVSCDICGREFSFQSGLTRHKQDVHENLRQFFCEKCAKGFKRLSALKIHQRIHSNDKPFKCEFCDYAARQRHPLNYHLEHKHGVKLNKRTDTGRPKSERPTKKKRKKKCSTSRNSDSDDDDIWK